MRWAACFVTEITIEQRAWRESCMIWSWTHLKQREDTQGCRLCIRCAMVSWIPNRERRTRGSHNWFYSTERTRGHFKIFFFPRTTTEWNKLPIETLTSQSLSIFNTNSFTSFYQQFKILVFIIILYTISVLCLVDVTDRTIFLLRFRFRLRTCK